MKSEQNVLLLKYFRGLLQELQKPQEGAKDNIIFTRLAFEKLFSFLFKKGEESVTSQ